MLRLLARWMLLVVLAFAAMIGVIRAQPYDHHGLDVLLNTPPDCAAPCWQGIRPGETSGPAALALVEPLTTVPKLNSQFDAPSSQLNWEFYGRLPLVAGDNRRVYIWLEDEVVNNIFVPDIGQLADLYLRLGKPETIVILSDAISRPGPVVYVSVYPGQIYLSSVLDCQSQVMDLWHASTNLHFGRPPEFDGAFRRQFRPSELPGWLPGQLCLRG